MKTQTIQIPTCTIRDYDSDLTPVTLTGKRITEDIEYPFIWGIMNDEDSDHERFFIFMNDGEWHEAQSIDFNY